MERTAGQRDNELVRQTAELLSIGGPLSDLFERFCLLLAQFVDASVVFIALDSDRGTHIEYAYDHGVTARQAHVPIRPESQTHRVMQTGESLLMRGPEDLPAQQVPLQVPGASQEDTASAIFVPLRFGSRPIGVLSVQSYKPGAYDERDLQLLETCALYVAVGVQQAQPEAAATDSVTGAATRRVFEERLELEWHRARRTGGSVGIILADIDLFKSFNQRYGHVAGDSCLAQVAQAVRGCVSRRTDLFARCGGEEFAALLPDVPADDAVRIAERMRRAIAQLQIPHAENPARFVTASFGVACSNATGSDARMLLRCADRALYAAKTAGRNRTVLERPRQVDEAPQSNPPMPVLPGRTVGRTIELDALTRSLALSRLTTLLGPPGVGKTHCALAVAHRLTQAFVHGAWFFDLRTVRDGAELRQSMQAALDDAAPKHALVVLDGCDRLRAEAAQACATLLEQAPRVTILATAAAPLELPQERVFHLSPFTRDDAAAFFFDRATATAPGIIFDAKERAAMRGLCERLGDLPLSIDLIAPFTPALPLSVIDSMLGNGPLDLGHAIDWSHGRLDERAQRLLARLSVFSDTFDADAARDVCGFAPLRKGEAAAAFEELADRHLIHAVHCPDRTRFRLLEPIARYAAAKLCDGEESALARRRHDAYYLELARQGATP